MMESDVHLPDSRLELEVGLPGLVSMWLSREKIRFNGLDMHIRKLEFDSQDMILKGPGVVEWYPSDAELHLVREERTAGGIDTYEASFSLIHRTEEMVVFEATDFRNAFDPRGV